MSPETLNRWRVAPRLLVSMYGLVCWLTFDWYTALPDPSSQQTTFATAIFAGAAAWFKFYVESGK